MNSDFSIHSKNLLNMYCKVQFVSSSSEFKKNTVQRQYMCVLSTLCSSTQVRQQHVVLLLCVHC